MSATAPTRGVDEAPTVPNVGSQPRQNVSSIARTQR